MIYIILLWGALSLPLSVIGSFIGYSFTAKELGPCEVNSLSKDIPPQPLYLRKGSVFAIGGAIIFL